MSDTIALLGINLRIGLSNWGLGKGQNSVNISRRKKMMIAMEKVKLCCDDVRYYGHTF